MFGRKKIAMLVAEFLGTMVLTLVVLAVQRSTIGIAYFVALASGLAYAGLSLVFAEASGGHFNPAVTVAAWVARKVKTLPMITYVVMQLLGGWAAYGLYHYFVNSTFASIGGHASLRLAVAEGCGSFIAVLVWAAVASRKSSGALAGAGYAVGVLIASIASLGIINPAVAIGTRAWAFWGSMGWWSFAVGPVVGGIVGYIVYELVFGDGISLKLVAMPAATSVDAVSVAAPKSRATSPAKRKATTAKKRAATK